MAWVSSAAYAAEITDVADSFDKENNNPFDARFELSYQLFTQSANIYREKAHPTLQYFCYGTENGCTNAPEFSVNHIRHQLNFRLAIGLYKDLELFVNIPLILYESIFTSITDAAKQNGSSLRNDGIVSADQLESRHTSVFGDMSLGFRWAPFNDYRDPTVATWVLGVSWTFPSGAMWNPLEYTTDPNNPNILNGGGVGTGTHRLSISFTWSKRLLFADPYIQVQANLHFVPDGGLRTNLVDPNWLTAQRQLLADLQQQASAATDPTTRESLTRRANQKQIFINNAIEQSLSVLYQGMLVMGSEFVFWENKMQERKLFLDLRFVLFATFQGRSPTIFTDAISNYRPTYKEGGIDVPERASLITDHEDYFTMYFQPALHFKIAKYGYIRLQGQFGSTLPFFLTRAKRGQDLPDPVTGRKNGFIDLGTAEVYPFHTRSLDGIGKRIQQRDTLIASFMAYAALTF